MLRKFLLSLAALVLVAGGIKAADIAIPIAAGLQARMAVIDNGDGTYTWAVAQASSSGSTGTITPAVSTAVEGSRILKASAGNLYSLTVTTAAVAGYVMVFDATSAPSDGAVTPKECVAVATNSTVAITITGPPDRYATGITAVFSSTGCFTKTISNTAFFKGRVL